MKVMRVGVLVVIALVGGRWAWCQGEPTRAPDLPPLVLPTAHETDSLPSGKPVSRPLQPVASDELIPVEARSFDHGTRINRTTLDLMEAYHPLGRYWQSLELLVWWPQAATLPPLLLAHRGTDLPILGQPSAQLLVGGRSIDSPDLGGGRFNFGVSLNETETIGFGFTYFFLGTRTAEVAFDEAGSSRPRTLARPVLDAMTGREAAVPVSIPGQLIGRFEASSSVRATGWEVTGYANLLANSHLRIHALAGYRYAAVNEGFRVNQYAWQASHLSGAADQFDTHNRFHGGQIGVQTDITWRRLFIEATGKVALGQALGVVRASGTTITLDAEAARPVSIYPVGVLGQATNAGRRTRSVFAVLPETTLRIGYRFRDRSRFYVGYNFLYLSEALRPGEQIDRMLDLSLVPSFPRMGLVSGTDRPQFTMTATDFWVQGLMFGLEYRY